MSKKKPVEIEDIYECKDKINAILKEYGCTLISADEWHPVILRDNDTGDETGIHT